MLGSVRGLGAWQLIAAFPCGERADERHRWLLTGGRGRGGEMKLGPA